MPQITLLKKTFQEQGNGIHKFMSDNHDGNQDQIPCPCQDSGAAEFRGSDQRFPDAVAFGNELFRQNTFDAGIVGRDLDAEFIQNRA